MNARKANTVPLDLYECVNWLFKLRGFGPVALTTDKLGERFYLHLIIRGCEEKDITQEFSPVSIFPNQKKIKQIETNQDIDGRKLDFTYTRYLHPLASDAWTFSAGHFISKHTKKFDVDDIRSWYDHSPKGLGLGVLHGSAHSGADFALAVNEIYQKVNGKRNLVEVYASLDT